MKRRWNPVWPFTENDLEIQRMAMNGINHSIKERTLLVSTEFFNAVATWIKIYGIWSCVQADTEIKWMKGMNAIDAKIALLKMGANFKFLNAPDPVRGAAHGDEGGCPQSGALQIKPRNVGGVDPSSPLTHPVVAAIPCRTPAQPRTDEALVRLSQDRVPTAACAPIGTESLA